MLSAILRRPSVVVAMWSTLVIGLFALHGDLSLDLSEEPQSASDMRADVEPVVVRRAESAKLPRATRSGRVFDSMGFLLVGAEVVLKDGRLQKTDADGSFAVDLLEHHTSDVLVRADGRRQEWLRTSAISPDPLVVCMEPNAPWDVSPQPLASAPPLRGEGSVHGPDGRPLASAFVNVLGTDCWGLTDQSGRLELPLPTPSATFVVHRSGSQDGIGGLASLSEPFSSPRSLGIVPLPPLVGELGGSIRGMARNVRGEVLAGLPVTVRGPFGRRCVQTDASGTFLLSGLLPAEYEVQPLPYRGAIGAAVKVRVDREVVACDLHLAHVEEASLRVVDESGAIAVGVWVAASIHGMRRGVGRAGADGIVNLPITSESQFDVRVADSLKSCSVHKFDADASPPTLVISQP